MGCRRGDGFDRVLLSCRQGDTGAIRTKSGEERCFENQREQNTRRGVVPLLRFHRSVAPKRKWLASLAIQVNTKRRYHANIGKPLGSRSNASAFSTGDIE